MSERLALESSSEDRSIAPSTEPFVAASNNGRFFGRGDGPLSAFSLYGDGVCRELARAGLLQKAWRTNVKWYA